MTEGESLMDRPTPTLQPMQAGYGTINISNINKMKPSTMQVKDISTDIDYDLFGEAEDIDIPQDILDKYS